MSDNGVPVGESVAENRMAFRAAAGTSLTAIIGIVPVFVFSALAFAIRRDVPFTDVRMGLSVSVFFAVAALCSIPSGRVADRLPPPVSLLAGAGLTALSLLGAAISSSWAQLTGWLAIAGVGNALIQVTANLMLSSSAPQRRRALSFGIKQSAVPASTLLGGLAVPTAGLWLGWRWVLGLGALVAAVFASWKARKIALGDAGFSVAVSPPASAGVGRLGVLAAAGGLGSGAATALGVFLVSFAVAEGVEPSLAGLILVVASISSLMSRLAVGWIADSTRFQTLPLLACMLGVGGIFVSLLPFAAAEPWTLGLVGSGAFATGWGWPGLLYYAAVQGNPTAPASASGVAQVGVYAGAALGPVSFGFVVSRVSYSAAWGGAASALVVASVLTLISEQRSKS